MDIFLKIITIKTEFTCPCVSFSHLFSRVWAGAPRLCRLLNAISASSGVKKVLKLYRLLFPFFFGYATVKQRTRVTTS